MRIKLFVETQNNVSGSRGHGAIYPMFSNWANSESWQYTDSENGECVLWRKITIEDGDFSLAYRKKYQYNKTAYTGQHTNLDIQLINGINENAPRYVYGELFSRNKYGCTKREFRLDLIRCEIQIKKGSKQKWFDFTPKNYID